MTEAQLAALREIADGLGLEAERQAKIKLGFCLPAGRSVAVPVGRDEVTWW